MSITSNLLAVSQSELDGLFENPETISKALYEDHYDEQINLDQAWQAILFVLEHELSGDSSLLSNVIVGIKPIGEEDVGYGPAHATPANIVKQIASKLATISDEKFCTRFDPNVLLEAEVYPEIWLTDGILNDYVLPIFKEMKAFYIKAAENDEAVITYFS